MISPSRMLTSGTMPPEGAKLSTVAFTAPARRIPVVTTANSADNGVPKRTSLPSMLPRLPSTPSAASCGLPPGLPPPRRRPPRHSEQHAHGRQQRPALALVADSTAERIGQPRTQYEDHDHLHEVRERRGILVEVRGVGAGEEAAAIGAQHLDGKLREATGPWAIVCLAPSTVVAST